MPLHYLLLTDAESDYYTDHPSELTQDSLVWYQNLQVYISSVDRILSRNEQIIESANIRLSNLEPNSDEWLKGLEVIERLEQQGRSGRLYEAQSKQMSNIIGEEEFKVMTWLNYVSSETSYTYDQLAVMPYPQFLEISNRVQVQDNLKAAHEADRVNEEKRRNKK
ncbi:hypothetical protein BCT49_20985 [Vibrio lentus]|uniref:Uncharacterized protein n=2 Tax=Vibrio lentus TaxID=136468 RepID=A0A2N7KM04_9VIBR|nr:hypothetical protein BCT49_20985 [Vibrio lentus]